MSVPNLLPPDPLSQVIFVQEYVQLVFQAARFSVYNVSVLRTDDVAVLSGDPGFADALVALIGQSVERVSQSAGDLLTLHFTGGATLSVSRMGAGPDAWAYQAPDGRSVAVQN